ncbi:MAG: hypothetical protein JXB17_10380 [Bacteroidales bacterium]|nr:hypothetical protein [Bacteroidales bacterium]
MKKVLLIIITIIVFGNIIKSQTDTVIYVETLKDTINDKYDRIYKLFILDKKEVKHLWKLDLVGFGNLKANIGFEKKVGRRFSFDSYLGYSVSSLYLINYADYEYYVNGSLKYYYNLKRRERLGKYTNRFNGSYICLGAYYKGISHANMNLYRLGFEPWRYYHSGLGLLFNIGLQRAIGNIGFFEPYLGLEIGRFYKYNYPFIDFWYKNHYRVRIYPVIGLKAGFAIDSFKGLKRKFKFN